MGKNFILLTLLVFTISALASENFDQAEGFLARKSGVFKSPLPGYDDEEYDKFISMDDDYQDNNNQFSFILNSKQDTEQESSIDLRALTHKCGNEVYYPLTHQCCNGILLSGYWTCSKCEHRCDDRCYPKGKGFKCCFNQVIPDAWQCCPHHCAGKCYNGETQKCCNDQIIPRSKLCCKDYCGDNCYEPKNTTCCNGEVIDKNERCCSSKCGQACYDKATKSCCHNKLIPVGRPCCSAAQRVCGNKCYLPSSHQCCHNKLIPVGRPCCSASQRVCGNKCYLPSSHQCCHNKIIPVGRPCCSAAQRVCGNKCYLPSSHQCCHNKIIPVGRPCCSVIDKNGRCCLSKCGQACIYTNAQHCCHERIAPKKVPCISGSGPLLTITRGLKARSVGCFRDHGNRAIPTLEGHSRLLVGSYRSRHYAIEKCALAAALRGWRVFAVQHQGWCASSPIAERTYNMYGAYNTCRNGKGGPWGNDVYVLEGNADKKTTKGEICVFPFVYKGKHYNGCTRVDHNRPWCAITPNYDVDRLWGNC